MKIASFVWWSDNGLENLPTEPNFFERSISSAIEDSDSEIENSTTFEEVRPRNTPCRDISSWMEARIVVFTFTNDVIVISCSSRLENSEPPTLQKQRLDPFDADLSEVNVYGYVFKRSACIDYVSTPILYMMFNESYSARTCSHQTPSTMWSPCKLCAPTCRVDNFLSCKTDLQRRQVLQKEILAFQDLKDSAARCFNTSNRHRMWTQIDLNICWNQHRMTSKIDIELKYHPNRCNLSEYIELHFAKIHERNVILVTLDGY